MAGKPKHMSEIKQLLQLHKQGKSKREITRLLDISRNTVKSYLGKLSLINVSTDSLLSLPNPELEALFHPGNPAYSDNRFEQLKGKLDYYTKELKRTGVTRKLLWQEYRQEYPAGYRPTQFYYHLSQHLSANNPSMVLEHKPGEKMFIDFAGKKLSTVDRQTGEIIEREVFVACMPYSDYSFAMAVRSQKIEDFLGALGNCLEDFGGVPELIVSDNLKSAVTKSDRYEPSVNQSFADFANHYETTIVPARAYKPKDKALVENQVKLIYSRVYAKLRNEIFFDLSSLNMAIKEKVRDHNQTRMQQKPFSREENFLANEKPLLKALTQEKFEQKYYRSLKVAKNNHIFLGIDKHYYSVPYIHIGATAKIIYTSTLVRIFIAGKQAAIHKRSFKPGSYSTVKDHLCSAHQHYLDRSPEYYCKRAKLKSDEFYQLICSIFTQAKHPEQLYRTCDGFFSLQRKTEPEEFRKACLLALDYKNCSYNFLKNIIKNKMTSYQEKTQNSKPLPKHKNIRGKNYFIETE